MGIKQLFQRKGNSYIAINPTINVADYDPASSDFAWAMRHIGVYAINTDDIDISAVVNNIPVIYRVPYLSVVVYSSLSGTDTKVYQYTDTEVANWADINKWKTIEWKSEEELTALVKNYIDGIKGVSNGLATLDVNGKVPASQLDTELYEIVTALPTSDIKTNIIYAILNASTNTYDKYIYINNKWETFGSSSGSDITDCFVATDKGVYIINSNTNDIYLSYDENGLDVAQISNHFIELINKALPVTKDAPIDGNIYGRQNGTWKQLSSDVDPNSKRRCIDLSSISNVDMDNIDLAIWGYGFTGDDFVTQPITLPFKDITLNLVVPESLNLILIVGHIDNNYMLSNTTYNIPTSTCIKITDILDDGNVIRIGIKPKSTSTVKPSLDEIKDFIATKQIAIYYEDNEEDVLIRNKEAINLINVASKDNVFDNGCNILQLSNLCGDITRLENVLKVAEAINAKAIVHTGWLLNYGENATAIINTINKHNIKFIVAPCAMESKRYKNICDAKYYNVIDTINNLNSVSSINDYFSYVQLDDLNEFCIAILKFTAASDGTKQFISDIEVGITTLPSRISSKTLIIGDFNQVPNYNFDDNTFYDDGHATSLDSATTSTLKSIYNTGTSTIYKGVLGNTNYDAITKPPTIDGIAPNVLYFGMANSNPLVGLNPIYRDNGHGLLQDLFNCYTLYNSSNKVVVTRIGHNISQALNKRDYMIINSL